MIPVHRSLALLIVFGAPAVVGAQNCKEVLAVDAAIKNSRSLNGKVICVRGILRPISDSKGTGVMVHELISAERASAGQNAIGVMDWSVESGIDAQLYKPGSFRRLDELLEGIGGIRPSPRIEVVFRGAIMNEKGLFKGLSSRLPRDTLYDPLRGLSYSVEFVLLEVISANKVQALR
jgi:hypothetical protein